MSGAGACGARSVRVGQLAMVLSAAAFGGTWVAAPWATDEIPPLTVACIRFAIASVLLFAYCRATGLPIRAERRDVPIIVGVALTSTVGYNVLFLYGVTLAPSTHGAVIVPGLIPGATVLLARVLFGERIAAKRVAGVGISVAGLILVVGPALQADPAAALGDALFAIAAVVWATYTIIGRAATRRFHSAVITLLATTVGAVILLPLAFLEPGGFGAPFAASVQALGGILYLGTLGTVVSFVFFYEGVRRLGAARASSYSVLIPLFGVSLAVLLLGETMSATALFGAAVVLAGLWLAQAPSRSS